MDPSEGPPIVTLHVWGVRATAIPLAFLHMATDRAALRRTPGLRFAKLLGTGDGRTFTMRDADLGHWGVLGTWAAPAAAEQFEDAPLVRSWNRLAHERLRVRLRPIASRGTWAGATPFGDPHPAPYDGPVAAVTRARIAPRHWVRFWRSVPPVSADLHRHPGSGLRLALGIGEAPVGLQGTFSLWESGAALTEFAHRRGPHAAVVRRTAEVGWYTEELFARLAVESVDGTFGGRTP